jgi:hypothetical protein
MVQIYEVIHKSTVIGVNFNKFQHLIYEVDKTLMKYKDILTILVVNNLEMEHNI